MIKFRFDGPTFTGPIKSKIQTALEEAVEAAKKAAAGASKDNNKRRKWFGAGNTHNVEIGADAMNKILENDERTLTFVDIRGKKYDCVKSQVEKPTGFKAVKNAFRSLQYSVKGIPQAPPPPTMTDDKSLYAQVFASRRYGGGDCKAHTGTGMRIFLGPVFFKALDGPSSGWFEAPQTIYHEVSHKVLDTDDDEYGVRGCLQSAISSPGVAITTADNWAYWAISYVHAIPGS